MNLSPQNIVQIIFVVLVFVVPALVNFVKYLKKQRDQREREQLRERAQAEALRTGRDVGEVLQSWGLIAAPQGAQAGRENPTPLTETQARKAEMEARRKAQLDDLRRRAEMRRKAASGAGVSIAGGGAATAPSPMRRAGPMPQRSTVPPGMSPPRVPQRRSAQQPPPQRIPTRARPAERFPAQRPDQRRRAAPRPQPTPVVVAQPEYETTNRLVGESKPTPPTNRTPRVLVSRALGPMTAADWRRAVIIREILGRPIAMRPPETANEILP